MKKLTLNKKPRLALILVLILFIILSVFLIFNNISNPGFEDKKIPLYTYNYKSKIDYSVYLKQNNLYKEKNLKKGKIYITEFVDYIGANLKYEFNGERATDVKGEYNIIAKVKGFTGEGEDLVNIWEKDFPIKQNEWFNSNDGKILINESVILNLIDYNTFVKEIKESSKIKCSTVLTLIMNIDLTGITDKGPIEKSISPSLIIPLDVDMFEITEENIVDQTEAIEEIKQVQKPINKNLIIIYGIILVFLIIALIILIFFTKLACEKNPLEKELSRIFKKYGDRLVALNSDISITNSKNVNSIEDLVKIADEIERPIVYKYCENKEINKFYVSDVNEMFLLDLKYLDNSEQTNDKKDIMEDIITEDVTEQIKTDSQLSG
ncbi:MAG: hypothetical protein K0R54_4682 [Clostridiaceae bacterium]|jgi:uncharacterized protein YpmB|nr:hypothetical protein [Clostridiaceae bacterium]